MVLLGYLEIMSHSLTKRKHPDLLVDSCQHLNMNQVAAGLSQVMQFFLVSPTFQHSL